jgi:two-component system cell cycle sensor histidine kinase/response regulator CckA
LTTEPVKSTKEGKSREPLAGKMAFWQHPAIWAALSAGLLLAALILWVLPGTALAEGGLMALALLALVGFAWAWSHSRAGGHVADLLLAAAEESPEARLITAADGSFIYANAAFHRLFALAVSLDDIAAILNSREHAAETFSRLRASASSGVSEMAEISLSMPSGGIEWRRISVHPLGGGQGRALWRAQDITARREMDAIRRREEEMLADFLDNLPAGFFSADGAGRILHANNTLAEWLGVSAGDMLSREMCFADFVVASEQATGGGSDKQGKREHGNVTLKTVDGTTFRACLVQSERLDADGEMAYSRSIVLKNLTWRNDMEAGALAPEQRLHWLFDEAPVGILLLDLHGNVSDCNRAFLRLLGVHREAVVGQPFSDRLAKEDRGDVAAQLSKVVMGIMRAAILEVRMPAVGERQVVASLFASRMEDDRGEVSYLVLHFIDTTEQKNLEVQFAQSQKMQAVGQLAGGVAHDFNNLLTAMIGFSDLLLSRHGPDDPSFADIMQIRQNANRATNLVRQLLAFSRQQTLKPVILDPTEALSELSTLLGRLIGENIELEMEPGRDLWVVMVDRGQFDQVIINLAVNARDAMPGGGTLTIRTQNIAADETVQRGHEVMPAGDYVLIEAMDTGVGIAKENIGHIFEPFFSTKDVGGGTGLGLSTVYGIVHQTGGFIFVDSAPGEGTGFGIYLPRYKGEAGEGFTQPQEQAEKAVRPPKPPPPPGADADTGDLTGAGTVLLVEDEEAVRMFGARALRNKGYRVLEASNGETALDVINSTDETIDLIISDVVMPGMDGRTLIQLVRQEMPDIKLILMSGYAENSLVEDIGNDPTIRFLAKPFSLKELAGTVKEVMSG